MLKKVAAVFNIKSICWDLFSAADESTLCALLLQFSNYGHFVELWSFLKHIILKYCKISILITLNLKCIIKTVLVSACSQSCVLRALTVRHLVLIWY